MSTRSSRKTSGIDKSPPLTRRRVSESRSPARKRESSPPARSPSRKSPGRKSPSRKPRRKSPSRSTKDADETQKFPSRSTKDTDETQKPPGSRPSIKVSTSTSVDSKATTNALPSLRMSTRSRRSDYSIKDLTVNLQNLTGDTLNGMDSKDLGLRNRKKVEEYIPRRSKELRDFDDHSADNKSKSKSISKSVSKSVEFSDGDTSDEDHSKKYLPQMSLSRKLATPLKESVIELANTSGKWEFGGRVGSAVLMLLIPVTFFTALISCQKTCSVKSLIDMANYRNVSLFTPFAGLLVLSQLTLQALISILPFLGSKSDRMDGSGKKYCFNAFFSSIVTVTLVFILDFFKIIDSNLILNEFTQLATASYVVAVILSVVLYIKSLKVDSNNLNSYGNSGYVLYDFWMGREIHPFILNLDVKIWISRICNINALVLAVLLFKHGIHISPSTLETANIDNYRELLGGIHYKPTILLFTMMQIVYLLNFIIREHKVTSTFFWSCEGVGYMQTVASALYPFYFMSISKFVVDNGVSLSTNTLIATTVLYIIGFLIMLVSNNIKYTFRNNPLQPSCANLNSMPTFLGKKLLICGPWGVVRRPNYAGDMLIHLALAVPGLLTGSVTAALPLFTVLLLLHRAWRDHSRCLRRYGAAWQRYCKRVPYLIIPKVF